MRSGGEIVYVAVGANLGDREATFGRAIDALERSAQILLLAASPVFETDPVGPPDQGAYLNAVVALRTWLSPHELLAQLQAIEAELGRDRGREALRWGPRTIDLDLLFYGERCIETPELVVPHPRAHERAFVLRPLAEIAPRYVPPRLGRTIRELVLALAGREGVRPFRSPSGWPGGALSIEVGSASFER